MSVLLAEDVELSFGDHQVLKGCSVRVAARDRIGLVGANGCGKSTLLSLLAGKLEADTGRIACTGRRAILDQMPDLRGASVGEALGASLAWHAELLADYEAALEADDLDRAATLQGRLDEEGWVVDHKIEAVAGQLGVVDSDRSLEGLSGGEQRRLALAVTLLAQPDVLLLDEPTNHLDTATINWLERFLSGYRGAVVLVTHDRYLLEAVADRIVEIEHGKAVAYDGSYTDFLISRAERHAILHRTEDRRLRMLARESAWAARSPAARTGKQKARLKRLDTLQKAGTIPEDRAFDLDLKTGFKSSGTVLEAYGLHVELGGRTLIDDLDIALRPGDRIGVIGPNGAGKSTLLRVLDGKLTPDAGTLHTGPRVRIGVLDQARTGLDPTDTLFEAAGAGSDRVKVGDGWVHVAGFLGRLLFRREQFDAQVSGLSGGERARLLLARKMLEGNVILLLDEPTNDLDLWTLRILEEALLGFDGAAVIVTHDRAFLDRVCTSVLAFEGDGRITRYADRVQAERAPKPVAAAKAPTAPARAQPKKAGGLSYKDKQELAALPDRIEALEARQGEIEAVLAAPETYRDRPDDVPDLNTKLASLTSEIQALYDRWTMLSEQAED